MYSICSSDTWYDEVSDWSRHEVSNFQGSNGGPAIGHYTQMVWAKADRVGCGLSANRVTQLSKYFLLNFPALNITLLLSTHRMETITVWSWSATTIPATLSLSLCTKRELHALRVLLESRVAGKECATK